MIYFYFKTQSWLENRQTRQMGDHLHADEPSRNVTSHPGQLSLAIPPWVKHSKYEHKLASKQTLGTMH